MNRKSVQEPAQSPALLGRGANHDIREFSPANPLLSVGQAPAVGPPGEDFRITSEERLLLVLISEGHPMTTVARKLHTSDRTLRRQTRALCEKLGVFTIVGAVAWAARRGLI